jgi:hypothetical protein
MNTTAARQAVLHRVDDGLFETETHLVRRLTAEDGYVTWRFTCKSCSHYGVLDYLREVRYEIPRHECW